MQGSRMMRGLVSRLPLLAPGARAPSACAQGQLRCLATSAIAGQKVSSEGEPWVNSLQALADRGSLAGGRRLAARGHTEPYAYG